MKGHLYYISKFSDGEEIVQESIYSEKEVNWQYKTKENAMEYISSHESFVRWATKQEYNTYRFNTAMKRMKPFFETDNINAIFSWLRNNDNIFSIKCFEILSGVKLSKTMKVRMQQLKEYYGQKYLDYENEKKLQEQQEEQEEKKKQQEEYNKLEEKFINGEDVKGCDFVEICNKNNINIPIRTKGYILKYVDSVNISGHYTRYGKGKSNSFTNIFWVLKDKLTNTYEDDCSELFTKNVDKQGSL